MELISVIVARTIWFFDTRDINPRGMNPRSTLLPALVKRYNFAKYPTEINFDLNREPGDKFLSGEFKNPNGVGVTINFISYDDGLVAETGSSTRDSEAFLEELLQWMVKDFGLVFRPEMIRKRGYVSELFIRSQYSLDRLNSQLKQFAARLSSLVTTPGESILYEPSGILFFPNTNAPLKPSVFRFERVLDAPLSENRYYSQAPLHTDIHLQLLNEFEQILIG